MIKLQKVNTETIINITKGKYKKTKQLNEPNGRKFEPLVESCVIHRQVDAKAFRFYLHQILNHAFGM